MSSNKIEAPSDTNKLKRELFTFEVFLEEDVCLDKITLREGDSPEELASEFVIRHSNNTLT